MRRVVRAVRPRARPGLESSIRRAGGPTDRLAAPFVRPPGADGVEVLQAEAERVHAAVARGAGRVGPVLLHPLSQCAGVGPRSLPSLSASTPDGGGDGGVPRMFSRIHLPRLTGEVRVGFDVAARMLAWVSTPPRGVPASETRRNQSPDDAAECRSAAPGAR